ncbi:MAG: DUF2834 domain-containing protein [Pseudomonadota bacterium]
MAISRKSLCVVYALIAVAALVGTWGNVLDAVGELGFVAGTLQFWQDVLVNDSSRFITVDILFLSLAVIIWMLIEARKLGIRWVWLYVVGGLFIAISAAVPLFLIHRELKLGDASPDTPAGTLETADWAGLAVLTIGITAFSARTLTL